MMHETEEMKKDFDKIYRDYLEGFDVMDQLNASIKKYLIPFCEDCQTENVTPKHDCEEIQQRKKDERDEKAREYLDSLFDEEESTEQLDARLRAILERD